MNWICYTKSVLAILPVHLLFVHSYEEIQETNGTTRIFLNIKGKNRRELPKALAQLLDYLEDPGTTVLEDQRVKELDNRLQKVKQNKEARDQYMTLQNLIEEERDEAHAAGETKRNIAIIRNMFDNGYDVVLIVDMLEQGTWYVENIYSLLQEYPEYTDLKIAEIVLKNSFTDTADREKS
ncbi:MAG: hypothetical protein HDT30_13640 [Clostridiales bacterium]|nr:hypothetical protein [Clostridiales bacterium]